MSAAPSVAAPSSSPSPVPGQKVCDVNDDRLGGDNNTVTGMAATAKGYDVVNDADQTVQVYQISAACAVTPLVQDTRQPDTPADLAVAPDGSVWVADIGDPQKQRDSVAIWKFTGNQDGAQRYRLSYPDGPKDAAALLVSPNGTPAIVTKEPGAGRVYVPTAALSADQTVPLKLAGTIKLTATGTPGGVLGPTGQRVFTGGAVSPDGKKAVLRTYTDAYEWTVTGGDVATSVLRGKPVRTPLPNEPDGEAISYSPDGKYFLTMADGKSVVIDRYAPAVATVAKPSDAAKTSSSGMFGNLTLTDLTNIVIVVGVIGLILLVVGFVGVRRARRNAPPDEDGGFDDGETAVIPRVTAVPPPGAARRAPPPPPRRAQVPDDVDTDVIGVVRNEPIPPRGSARPEPPRGNARPEPPRGPRGTARSQPAPPPDTGWSAGSRWRDEERPRGGGQRGGEYGGRGRYDDRYDRDVPYDRERPPPRRGYPDEPEPYRPRSR
jgi:hypothetical protein